MPRMVFGTKCYRIFRVLLKDFVSIKFRSLCKGDKSHETFFHRTRYNTRSVLTFAVRIRQQQESHMVLARTIDLSPSIQVVPHLALLLAVETPKAGSWWYHHQGNGFVWLSRCL